MKHLLILTSILLLSCIDKQTPVAKAEIVAEKMANTLRPDSKKTKENSYYSKNLFYQGTINGTIGISLYINEQENPCGGHYPNFFAMYKYTSQNTWILLDINVDSTLQNFCMVEDAITGVLLLKKEKISLNGYWVSPDAQQQYKVTLIREAIESESDSVMIDNLNEILFDDLIYNKNDC